MFADTTLSAFSAEQIKSACFAMLEVARAHGISAAPLADRYARWYEQHPRDKAPPMESAPAEVTRARGSAGQPTS